MHINLESEDKHSIHAYSDEAIQVNGILYQSSLIISRNEIINPWPISSILQLNETLLEPLLRYKPKTILIGHKSLNQFAPPSIMQALAKDRIGLEQMSIGAACRTFNVMLSERRDVVIGIILT
jgi:uncharacterized protein